MPYHTYKNLDVWKAAMDLTEVVYNYCNKLPNDERYGLVSQMTRAAVSVPSNIAEGQGRGTFGEIRQSARHAIGSLYELETQLLLCERLWPEISAADIHVLIDRIDRMLNRLYAAVRECTAAYDAETGSPPIAHCSAPVEEDSSSIVHRPSPIVHRPSPIEE